MKFNYRPFVSTLAILFIICGFTACKSTKSVSTGGAQADAGTTPAKVVKQSAAQAQSAFARMTSAYRPWSDVTVPVKVSVTKPKKLSVSGTLTMAYGKSLSLSMKMLFIEAASVYADTDSVFVVSKPLGAYYAESLAKFTASSGLTLADLQTLMLGQAFAPGEGTATPESERLYKIEDYDLGASGAGYEAITLTPRNTYGGVDWHMLAVGPEEVGSTPQILALEVTAGENNVECSFASAETSAAGPIAARMQVQGTVKKHAIDLEVSATTSRASWNTGAVPARVSIPGNARRMTTEQVLKMLNSL